MKKWISVILVLFFGVLCAIPLFSCIKKETASVALSTQFNESELKNRQDIVSTDKNLLSQTLRALADEYSTPFDNQTKQAMPGVSITPTADAYGQVRLSFSVPSFKLDETKSIFVWVFIPDEMVYSLSIEIFSGRENLKWNLSSDELSNIYLKNSSLNGWKLFEFVVTDAEQTLNEKSFADLTFTSAKISYVDELGLQMNYSNNTLSFYNMFLADSFSRSTTVLKSNLYSYYEIDASYKSGFENVYVDDEFNFVSPYSFFSYLVVGKNNLKVKPNNNYTISAKITSPSNREMTINEPTNYKFSEIGSYAINIKINEYRNSTTKEVLSVSIFCSATEFKFGSFSDIELQILKGETRSFSFRLSDEFELDGDLVVEASDKNIASVTYYVTHNTCEIQVSALQRGKIKIEVKANGKRQGKSNVQEFSMNVNVEVGDKNISKTSLTILWITLSVYLIGFAIYVIISLLKNKKSGVK